MDAILVVIQIYIQICTAFRIFIIFLKPEDHNGSEVECMLHSG